MTTTKSFLKKECWPLIKYYLWRNRAAGVCFFVGSFLCFPLQYILEVFRRFPVGRGTYYFLYGPAHIHTGFALVAFSGMMIALPVLLTLAQVYWLHSRRGTDLYHSLPVRRESLLLANAGAAFLTIAVPVTADYLIIAVAGSVRRGMRTPGDPFFFPRVQMALDYLGWMVTALALVAVTLLVATQVGGVFENFLFAVELLCAPVGLYLVFNTLCHSYLAGFSMASYLDEMLFTSPLTMMVGRLLLWERYVSPPAVVSWCVPLWCVLAALLLWAACRLYQNRPSELAETSGAREPLNTLGKLGLAYMGGLLLALILHNNLFSGRAGTFWLTALCCVTLVVVTAQVILGRGFHSLKKALPGMAAVVAAITVFAYGMGHGGFGYSTYIPKDPESVTLSFRGRYGQLAERCLADVMSVNENGQYAYDSEGNSTFTTPEGIALVADLHRALAKQAMEAKDRAPFAGNLRFSYSNGTKRIFGQWGGGSYFFPARDVRPILALEESRALREQTDPRFTLTAEEVQAVRVTDATGLATGGPVTDQEAIARLVEAMRLDAEAFDPAVLREGEARAAAYLTVETPLPKGEHWSDAHIDKDCWRSFTLPVYRTDAHTYEALWTVLGRGEMTGRLHQEEVTALDIQWWGSPADTRGAYWVGAGPESLFPTRTPADPLPSLNNNLPHKCIRITDPGEMRQILDACLGRDCHLADAEGFIVTIQGGDRTGCSFWLGMEEMTPGLRKWYEEEDLAKYRRVAQ